MFAFRALATMAPIPAALMRRRVKNLCYREGDQHREYRPERPVIFMKGVLKALTVPAPAKAVIAKPAGRRRFCAQVLG